MNNLTRSVVLWCCAVAASAAMATVERAFTLSGDTNVTEAITAADDLRITIGGIGTLFLGGGVSSTGTLTFNALADTITWGSEESTTYVRETDILIAPGKSIDDWEVVDGWMKGSSVNAGAALGYRAERGQGWLKINMCKQDSVNVKMRKLQFTDTAEGIVVKSLYKSYKTTTDLNTDFDNDAEAIAHRTAASTAGYEISKIVLRDIAEKKWIKPTASVTANALALESSAHVAFVDGATLGEDGAFAGGLSGGHGNRLSFGPDARADGAVNEVAAANGVVDNSSLRAGVLVAGKTDISSVLGVFDTVQSQGVGGAVFDSDVYFFTNNGTVAECQVQGTDVGSLCKVTFLTLYQKGVDVYGVVKKVMYAAKATYPKGTDYRTIEGLPGVTTREDNLYPITSFKMRIAECPGSTYALRGQTSMANASWDVQSNTVLSVENSKGLPSGGIVNVYPGGNLQMLANQSQLAGMVTVNVNGGVLAQGAGSALESNLQIVLDGGLLALSPVSYASTTYKDDSGTYVRSLTLRNGSRISGLPPRVGSSSSLTWTVEGSSPSVCATGIKLVRTSGYDPLFTFDVADTGDAAADFTVEGPIYDMAAALTGLRLAKRGAGTMRLGGASTCTSEWRLEAGVLSLGVSNAVCSSQPVVFAGGTLSVEAGLEVAAGELSVAADSGVALAAGATLSFSGVAADGLSSEAQLSVTGPAVGQGARSGVRIGTTACLATGQIRAIRYNGLRVQQDEDGWLLPYKPGITLILR